MQQNPENKQGIGLQPASLSKVVKQAKFLWRCPHPCSRVLCMVRRQTCLLQARTYPWASLLHLSPQAKTILMDRGSWWVIAHRVVKSQT